MKKRLAAAITTALVVGVASTTFAAANPFVDVPAKHWSYDAVTKLAQAGIVDGYGDGTFRGDKTITRYEMAQIVAKAMTKSDKADASQKAALDKLAVEFSAELNNLGVRVAKLEANQSKVKFSGDARIRFVDNGTHNTVFSERVRLNIASEVNENTSFYGRMVLAQHNEMGTNWNGDNGVVVTDGALTTKNVFNTDATSTIGRFSQKFLSTGYFMDTTGLVDGVKVTFGNKLKVTAGFANFNEATGYQTTGATKIEEAAFAQVVYPFSKATTGYAMYLKETSGAGAGEDYDVYGAGFTAKVGKYFTVLSDYTQNTAIAGDPTGYVAKLNYKGANPAKAGSFGLGIEYRKFETGMNDFAAGNNYVGAAAIPVNNVKGWAISANKAIAKNITLEAFQTFESKKVSTGLDTDDYTRAQINFNF